MNELLKELYAAGHKAFDLPIERMIAFLRVALAFFCLTVLLTEPGLQRPYTAPFEGMVAAYALFGLVVALLPTMGNFRTGWQLPVHLIDIGVVSVLMYFVERLSSTLFILYIFVQLSATFRWNWRGALWTTLALIALQMVLASTHRAVPPLFPIQWAFLLIIGGVFVFFGVSRARSDERLTQLAAWPRTRALFNADTDNHWLDASLIHISTVMQVPRVLVLWEILQEPYSFANYFADGKCQHNSTIAINFDSLVSPELEGKVFATEAADSNQCLTLEGIMQCAGPLIDGILQARFEVASTCSAPFSGEFCRGRVFMLDRPDWKADDLVLTEIAASHLHGELEFHAISIQLKETAASRERIRLARDLHDGVLQTLTAAGLQLTSIASHSEQGLRQRLEDIQKLLLGEQQRIRAFIGGHQPLLARQNCDLNDMIQHKVEQLKRQWACIISPSVTPSRTTISLDLMQQMELLIAEAVANAVQHGNASQINITVECKPQRVRLQIVDNGVGLKGVVGTYRQSELAALSIGPQSIFTRVAELRGTLTLVSSLKGVELHIEIPCNGRTPNTADDQAAAFG